MAKNKLQSNKLKELSRFWIIGAGRFGRIAMERIAKHKPDAVITVIDKKPRAYSHGGITTIRQDGIQWLYTMLEPDAPVDIIVPAIPVHVAAEWLKYKLLNQYKIKSMHVPDEWVVRLPHAIRGGSGQVYTSHADFICPDNCPEPEKICTHSGKPRPMDLFRLLDGLDLEGVLPVVLRSHQLLPGVGGIYPEDLIQALDDIRNNSRRSAMVATACRCHGVVDFFTLD